MDDQDEPLEFDSESSTDDEHGFSDSGSDSSFESDFDPESLRSHNRKVTTPRPSLTELEGILGNLKTLNLDEEFMLDDIKMEMEIENNNKKRNSFSYDEDKPVEKDKDKDMDDAKTTQAIQVIHTDTVSQTRIGKKWYINQYLCYKYLGKGSFGKVCLAKDILTNKKIAIKVLNKSLLRRKRILRKNKPATNMLENIFREIAIMKKLNHPNLIKIFEVIDDPNNDKLYMVIDYMNNGSVLGEKGAEAKCEPMKDHELIRKYMRDMILGLDYLHANDIIHGDIKPENLLLSRTDQLKIADFGVSFMLDAENCPNADGKISRSQGTPAFTAPEAGSRSFSAYPTDIWAMGVTLYMMITGICPFAGDGIYDTYDKIQSYSPPMDELKIEGSMRDFLTKILLKDPNQRITLAQAMVHDWITNNGKEPLQHPQTYQKQKFEKRVSVTKADIEYAVNLPENTIKHLRKASDTMKIKNKKIVIESEHKEEEQDDDDVITQQPPKKISNKKAKKPTKKLPSKAPPSQASQSKPSIKKKKGKKRGYNPLTDANSANSIIVNMNQVETVTYTSKPIKNGVINMNKKPKTKAKKTPRKPSKNAPVAPKSKSKSKKFKLKNKSPPTKPSKVAPINKYKGCGSRKSTPNVGAKKKKKTTKKGPLSPKNKALPPSIKKKNKKKKHKLSDDTEASNLSPSFVKRRTGSDIKRNKSKSSKNSKNSKDRKKNKNGSKNKVASPKRSPPQIPKNKPLPKSNKKKVKQTKNPTN